MEYIGKALEVFLDKHLIPTVISFVLMVIINLLLPENCWIINKLGINLFRLFVFGICFIVIQLLIWFKTYCFKANEVKIHKNKIKNKKIEVQNERIKEYRKFADKMSYDQRELIIELIKTNNEPIEYVRWLACARCELFNEDPLFHKTKNKENKELIKLDEDIYEVYSDIYKRYGKIGNF